MPAASYGWKAHGPLITAAAFFSVNSESMAFSPLSPRIPAGKTLSV
jgi:hypothetical protein